jgi:2-octaprenyl-6-methoxyphenol hydroxylase
MGADIPDDRARNAALTQATARYDIVIAGAGTVGLALACALADSLGPEARIALVDRADFGREPMNRDIRAWAISAGSKRLLDALGVWPELAEHVQPVTAVDITDSSLDDGIRPILLSYDNRVEADEPATYIVESERLNAALLRAARLRPGLALLGGSGIGGFDGNEQGCTIDLDSGARLRAPLLVAADGRASRLRDMAGIKIVRWSYPQIGIVTTVRHDKPHGGRAVQHFLPAGPFAILPLTGNRSCITWTEDAARGRDIVALDDAGFLAEVEKRFGYRLGRVELAGPRASWPLDMHLARALVADGFALVGDAAHGVHPIAGQGLNLGLRDVAALTEVVVDSARLGLDVGSLATLTRYERWRRLDSALSAATFDALNRLFSNDFSVARTARDFGLGLVERMPALKQFFVAEAAGLTGEVPKLLRGLQP